MKKLTLFFLCSFIFFNFGYSQSNESDEEQDIRMPFDKVIYIDERPHIYVQEEWAKLLSIADLPIDTFINNAKEVSPRNWKRDIHEYLYIIMDELQIKRGKTIKVSYSINDKIYQYDFELKKENGDLAAKFHDSIVKSNRVIRKHILKTDSNYKYLNTRIYGYDRQSKDWVTAKQATHDLEYLEWEIDNNYSYAELTGFDYKVALDAIRNDLHNGIATQDLALQLKMFMANFGDGHSRVSIKEVLKGKSKTWLPFQIIKHDEHFFAFDTNTKDYYLQKHPMIVEINGISIDELYRVAKQMIPKSTSKYIERNATNYLFYIELLLQMKNAYHGNKVEITFNDGKNQITKSIDLGRYKFQNTHTNYLLRDSILSHNLGYIAMNVKMEKEDVFIDNLNKAMLNIKETDGLIIDIRRNGGGSRKPLLTLLPYFIKKAKIVNVARYRINADIDHNPNLGYLKRRFCFPTHISKSNYEEENSNKSHMKFIEAVNDFKNSFKPKYDVDNDKFSDLHYMAIHPHINENGFYYDKPVIVLIDEGCFSASDIFAAGIKTGDNVKLLGNTTGGGSGYADRIALPNSNINIKLSRMVSYQPDGNLYDGHGVNPDIPVAYTLEDRIGKTDSMLEKALELLNDKSQK